MSFPVHLELVGFQLHPHQVMETLAYVLGAGLFFRLRRVGTSGISKDLALAALAGCACGALCGAKAAAWLQNPSWALADFPDWERLREGKSVLGGLLGGIAGVEVARRLAGIPQTIGDLFVWPVMLGMATGRIGCFLSGLDDHAFGNPTNLPWGVDFGDGMPRHPTQLYEIAFLALCALWLARIEFRLTAPGDRFRAFMIAYLVYRFCAEYIKPMPMAYFGLFSGLQLLCLAGLVYYRRDILRIAGSPARASLRSRA